MRHGSIAILVMLAACNSVLGIDDVSPEQLAGSNTPDAGVAPPPDAAIDARPCDVQSDFTLVAATPATSNLIHLSSGNGASLLALLNNDAKPDALQLQLYDNMGGHGVVNAVGTYPFTAADSALSTCGVCVKVVTDYDAAAGTFSQNYFAVAQGTLKITTYDATTVSGSLKGLKLRQVDSSGVGAQDVPGGCTVTIEDAEFTSNWSTSLAPTTAAQRALEPLR